MADKEPPLKDSPSYGPRRFIEKYGPRSMLLREMDLPTPGQRMFGRDIRQDDPETGLPKKGSATVPSYCKGGKVIKSWSK